MIENTTRELLVLISAFAPGEAGAIHAYRLDSCSTKLESIGKQSEVENPFFLALSPDYRFLYSIHEPGTFGGSDAGQVSAFAFDRSSGESTLLNRQSSKGPGSCYLDVDSTGKVLVVANYTGGSVASLPINDDGSLGEAASFVQHEGSSVDQSRQQEPRAHSIVIDPTNSYAIAADLGLDKILIYRLDSVAATLTRSEQPFARTLPGAGPRHFTFHPGGDYAYCINESHNSVTVFRYDSQRGWLIELQTLSTLPDDFEGISHCADLKITPDGRFLYGTNRGHDSITIFSIDQERGLLTRIDIVPSLGGGPQNLAITPDGSLLIVANMVGNNVVTFQLDRQTGKLAATGEPVDMTSPSCIMLVS